MNDKAKTVAAQFAERLLVGAVNSIARAGARAFESITSDAKKALRDEADKVEKMQQMSAAWRATQLGDDLPDSLRDEGK